MDDKAAIEALTELKSMATPISIPKPREYTQEEKDAYARELYDDDRINPNLFSKWYPLLEKAQIPTPGSMIFTVPREVFLACYEPGMDKNHKIIEDWVSEKLVATMQPGREYFCKNGCFSNKFNFKSCINTQETILDSFMDINYTSLIFGTAGVSEFILRDVIPTKKWTKTIYEGMPLRPEFRVFYDFTKRKSLYVVNYWDYGYVAKHLHDEHDKKVFDEMRWPLHNAYEAYKETALDKAHDYMKHIEGLNGTWSVDMLLDDDGYLHVTDMAVGMMSAYYDYDKIAKAGGTE